MVYSNLSLDYIGTITVWLKDCLWILKKYLSLNINCVITFLYLQLSGVPGVIGCIDGTYINIRCPARKVRSTYINRHNDISMTLQAVCDHEKRFLDVTVGNPSKMHDAKIYRNSRLAARLPQICASGNYHILGDAAYPLRQYLLTPYRDYGKLTSQQKSFNARFSATRVRIENAFGDLKARFRQLLHLDFFVVDKINVFVISCCVLHNLCIKAGVEDIPFDPEDTGSDCTWQRLSHDDRESSGPQTAKETVLRQMGEQKRESVRQKMGLQWATWRPPAKFWTCKWSAQHTCENELFILCFLERRVEGERKVCRFWDRVRLVRVPFFRYASLLASWCFRVSASLFPVA